MTEILPSSVFVKSRK